MPRGDATKRPEASYLMRQTLSGGKATSSDIFLASVGARHDRMSCKIVDNYQSYHWFRCCGSG